MTSISELKYHVYFKDKSGEWVFTFATNSYDRARDKVNECTYCGFPAEIRSSGD